MLSARALPAQCASRSPSRSGINAVVDSPQQIVHFPRADFGLCIIQRHYAAETVLRKLKPGSSSFEVAKNAGRVLEQPGKTDELVRFIRRQASRSFAPVQRCPGNGKF